VQRRRLNDGLHVCVPPEPRVNLGLKHRERKPSGEGL
jgi:hypothetical protein